MANFWIFFAVFALIVIVLAIAIHCGEPSQESEVHQHDAGAHGEKLAAEDRSTIAKTSDDQTAKHSRKILGWTRGGIIVAGACAIIGISFVGVNAIFLEDLSASDAAYWLGSSTRVAIISGTVLLVGLVGELPESGRWKKSWLYELAKISVILSVFGELVGDAGIFKTSDRLQQLTDKSISANVNTEKAMLKQLSPRDFTKDEFVDFVSALRGNIKRKVTVYTIPDPEASQFGFEIAYALQEAQIPRDWVQLDRNEMSVPGIGPVAGISSTNVTLYDPGAASGDSEAKAEVDAFFAAAAKGHVIVGATRPPKPIPGVPIPSIFVGLKQPPFSWLPKFAGPGDLPSPPWEPR